VTASISGTSLREQLLAAGVLLPMNADGVYGYGSDFVRTFDAVDGFVAKAGAADRPELMRFPAVMSRSDIERTDYLRSFPDLLGAISAFSGDNESHADLLMNLDAASDWSHVFGPTELMLVPAACYPIYATIQDRLPPEGRLFEVLGTCFRHEPSPDPARMVMFHQHEFVRLSTPDGALAFRDSWLERAYALMSELGLEVESVVANDPFFGRAGRMLAANQRSEALKFEIVTPINDPDNRTAIVSCNWHRDHLASRFGIETADGEVANSACVGFGIERIVLALFVAHGLRVEHWPADVRAALDL
jgi:seryl-tRNA synthetase